MCASLSLMNASVVMSPMAKKSNRRPNSEEKIDDDIPLVYCILVCGLMKMWKAYHARILPGLDRGIITP